MNEKHLVVGHTIVKRKENPIDKNSCAAFTRGKAENSYASDVDNAHEREAKIFPNLSLRNVNKPFPPSLSTMRKHAGITTTPQYFFPLSPPEHMATLSWTI